VRANITSLSKRRREKNTTKNRIARPLPLPLLRWQQQQQLLKVQRNAAKVMMPQKLQRKTVSRTLEEAMDVFLSSFFVLFSLNLYLEPLPNSK